MEKVNSPHLERDPIPRSTYTPRRTRLCGHSVPRSERH